MQPDEKAQIILNQLQRRIGKTSAERLLSVLGRSQEFINAIETPLGQELLKDCILCIEEGMSVYLDGSETPETRAELNAHQRILKKWQDRINEHSKAKDTFDKATNV